MKKTLKTLTILLILLVLAGCENTNDKSEIIAPEIKLLGESSIEIEQYTEFQDPGAEIVNDVEGEVQISSNVDTSRLGMYTITYSVEYNFEVYSVTRSVFVIESSMELDFGFTLEEELIMADHMSLMLEYTDSDNLLENPKAILTHNGNVLHTYQLASGENPLNFNGLLPDTDYKLTLEGNYQVNGLDFNINDINYNLHTYYEEPLQFTITNRSVDYNKYMSDFTIDFLAEDISDVKLILWDNSISKDITLLEEGKNTVLMDDLIANHDYHFTIQYTRGENTIFSIQNPEDFTTATFPKPVINSFTCWFENNELKCELDADTTRLTDVIFQIDYWIDGLRHSAILTGNGIYTLKDTIIVETIPEYFGVLLYVDYEVSDTEDQYVSDSPFEYYTFLTETTD